MCDSELRLRRWDFHHYPWTSDSSHIEREKLDTEFASIASNDRWIQFDLETIDPQDPQEGPFMNGKNARKRELFIMLKLGI